MIVESPCPNLLIPDVNYADYVLRTLKKFGNETALVSITKFDPVVQGWAITFLSGPVTDNELSYWARSSKLNIKTKKNNAFTNS